MIEQLIAEATECDFKAALETKKPKSWLKSVSAFANGIGGSLIFGVEDNRQICGLADVQADAETISRLIKERITPLTSVRTDTASGRKQTYPGSLCSCRTHHPLLL